MLSPASSSRLRLRSRPSTWVESVRCRPPDLTSPSPASAISRASSASVSIDPATSRARNSESTVKSNPGSSNASPSAYFQSIARRAMSAACRSVRFSTMASTSTIISWAGEIPGLPRFPNRSWNRWSDHTSPSSSRIRIARLPLGNEALAALAVSAGTSGKRRG